MNLEDAWKIRREAEILATEKEVEIAIGRMAADITATLQYINPIILCVMNGGLITCGKLLTLLDFPLQVDYIHATRYGKSMAGNSLKWLSSPHIELTGRTVLLVDDILDEGFTLKEIGDYCLKEGAAKVLTAVLVEKQHFRKVVPEMKSDFRGLELEDRFLFGYGLDFNGYWRNAPGIFAIKK